MGNFVGELHVKFRWYFAGKLYLQNSHETFCPKLKNLRFGPFNSWLNLYMKKVMKAPRKYVFSHKNILKNFEKHGWYKSLSKANKKNKNLFGLIHIWLSTHTSYLNMYNHINEIDIHWTLDLSVVCVYQMWNSP